MREEARVAYCGLYCPLCSFVAVHETGDRNHLAAMPDRYDRLKELTNEECACSGCRDQVDRCHCDMKPCAQKKGLNTCADCMEFPCSIIDGFGHDGAPHHEDALRNLYRIREVGYSKWTEEMEAHMRCECGTRQSWYYRCLEHKQGAELQPA